MNRYLVQQVTGTPDWSEVPKAMIDQYPWGCAYQPKAYGQLVFVQEKGFLARLTCFESNPLATFENPDDSVCEDSCLEFFANFNPACDAGYLNCESNAKGTLLCGIGPVRGNRQRLRKLGVPMPKLMPFWGDGVWGYEVFIPMALLREVYGRTEFSKGDVFCGNFYKCGDHTASPHFGCWNPIQWEKPNFHLPDQFGVFELA